MLRIGNSGFTLLEVLVATAVLSLGIVFIYESFFQCLDLFNYCSDYIKASSWMDERIWDAQDKIYRFGAGAQIERKGTFTERNRDFKWNLSYHMINEEGGLFRLNLGLSWQDDTKRTIKLARYAYAVYKEEGKK